MTINVVANVIANVVSGAVLAPFIFAFGVWQRWWSSDHPPLAYVAVGGVIILLLCALATVLRSGVRSSSMLRVLVLAGVVGASFLVGWGAAVTSGLLQVVLGFLAFAIFGTAMFGTLMSIVAEVSGEDFDELMEEAKDAPPITM
ncbi:hypothetical protein [Amycolatopsis decaplanina]|uniref:Transmembrane protein n=1 Tax=Amycolatopsis decaplanina DSM 44594 TaxID=1284240 RepID=M2YF31_9PSEU|nr:hypothetical protein [Amycolatopsis decaplanina]EME60240.1 hypothetical protein H074_14477 [Amycolatopsis decaplanina DSM 44594]